MAIQRKISEYSVVKLKIFTLCHSDSGPVCAGDRVFKGVKWGQWEDY